MIEKLKGNSHAPQVSASDEGKIIDGCLLDGGSSINVMSKWLLDELR